MNLRILIFGFLLFFSSSNINAQRKGGSKYSHPHANTETNKQHVNTETSSEGQTGDFNLNPQTEQFEIQTLTFSNNKEVKVIEFKPNIFIKAGSKNNIFVNYLYAYQVFNDEIQIISLVTNSSTNEYLKNNIPKNHKIANCKTEAEFTDLLLPFKHKTIFLLGHIENGIFVNYSASGEQLFSIGLQRIKEISNELKINIFPLGCNSAESTLTEGVTVDFNSYEAAVLLSSAMHKSTIGEFIETLTSDNKLQILVDEETFADRKYGEYKTISVLKKVGTNYIIVGILAVLEFPEDKDEDEANWLSWVIDKIKKNLTFWLLFAAIPIPILFFVYNEKILKVLEPFGVFALLPLMLLLIYFVLLPFCFLKMFFPNIDLMGSQIFTFLLFGIGKLITPKKNKNGKESNLYGFFNIGMWVYGCLIALIILGTIMEGN